MSATPEVDNSLGQMRFYPETSLSFGYAQLVEDPRDGLTLFGPLDEGKPLGIRTAVIGTRAGIEHFDGWLKRIQTFLVDGDGRSVARPAFPGFEAVFRIPWAADPVLAVELPLSELEGACNVDDQHQRVYGTVSAYAERIQDTAKREEIDADLWFVVIPDLIYANCRPQSRVPLQARVKAESTLTPRWGRRLRREPSMFADENKLAVAYHHDVDFHNQLKARLLPTLIPTQVVRESTIAPPGVKVWPKRDMGKFQAAIAWNLSTAAFYKAGFKPWKLGGIRDGVCYIGLVFKRDEREADPQAACCAAQMFLDSGDGTVFRGAVGPWYSPDKDEYHMSRHAAEELARLAIETYVNNHNNEPPRELFIHGRVAFSDEEWKGFAAAVDPTKTQLVGVKIRDDSGFRLFRLGTRPIMRGSAYLVNDHKAFLWTKGYVPRLLTYPGLEVPRPLTVEVCRGRADLSAVLSDILALTKLNYNSCIFADGMPVTLRFANAVGEILTAAPDVEKKPLPFKYYI